MSISTSTDSKSELVSSIRHWKDCDSKIKHLNLALADLRKQRNQASIILMQIMQTNNVQELALKDGNLSCVVDQPFKQLNKKDLHDILSKYPSLTPTQAMDISDFIADNRVRAPAKQKIILRTNRTADVEP